MESYGDFLAGVLLGVLLEAVIDCVRNVALYFKQLQRDRKG